MDAAARWLYAKLFEALVSRCNAALGGGVQGAKFVGASPLRPFENENEGVRSVVICLKGCGPWFDRA